MAEGNPYQHPKKTMEDEPSAFAFPRFSKATGAA